MLQRLIKYAEHSQRSLVLYHAVGLYDSILWVGLGSLIIAVNKHMASGFLLKHLSLRMYEVLFEIKSATERLRTCCFGDKDAFLLSESRDLISPEFNENPSSHKDLNE